MFGAPEKKRIIIDDGLSSLNGCTGIGNYSRLLYESLNNYIAKRGGKTEIVYRNYCFFKLLPRKIRRVLYLSVIATANQVIRANIMHFTNFYMPPIRFTKAKFVVTIHDMAAWMFPEAFTSSYLHFIRPIITRAVAGADRIITVSNTVKREIIEVFGAMEAKIDVCYNAVRPIFKCASNFGRKQKYLLFVGNLDAQKNVPTLVKAFANLRKVSKYSDFRLIIVGKKRAGFDDLSLTIERENIEECVSIMGYVSDEDLLRLYQGAELLVMSSFYEGFGIPVVEAMACEIPVIASDIPVLREVAGNSAFFYGPAGDEDKLCEAIITVLSNESVKRDLVEKGKDRVMKYSCENLAERHMEVYNAVCQ